MNHIAAYPVPVPGGYRAMVRLSHKAQPWPLMDGERPRIFGTWDEAEIAALKHVLNHINGTMRRDGERVSAARSAADKLFMGGGKVVAVERKGARA